jgi:hypothetical protein
MSPRYTRPVRALLIGRPQFSSALGNLLQRRLQRRELLTSAAVDQKLVHVLDTRWQTHQPCALEA